MAEQNVKLQANPSEETIRVGPVGVRFLITGENSGGNYWRCLSFWWRG